MQVEGIERTESGFWVVKGDQWLGRWVHETGRLDQGDPIRRFESDPCPIAVAATHIKPGSVVIDVGANIGSHTIAYLKATGPEGVVVAYEPHPQAYWCLRLNCPQAVTFRVAVGERVCSAKLVRVTDNVGMSHLGQEGEDVSMINLDAHFDTLLRGLNKRVISLLKIDAEGCEPEILRGAETLITRHRPVILMEINHPVLEKRGNTHLEIAEFLSIHRYQVNFIPDYYDWNTGQSDIICIPMPC